MLENVSGKLNDTEVRDRDRVQKQLAKEYGDRKRRAVESEINEGEKVYYVKIQAKPIN